MPNAPISLLPLITAVTNSDIMVIVNSGVTSSITYDTIINSDVLVTRDRVINQSGFTITFSGDSKLIISQSLEQGFETAAISPYSHAEGNFSISVGSASHSEGYGTSSYGNYSHSEGNNTHTNGDSSHAEGNATFSNGFASHSEGSGTISNGDFSHTEGIGTISNGYGQHVSGAFNTTGDSTSLSIIGCGIDNENRADAFKVVIISGTTSTIVLPQVIGLDYVDDSSANLAGIPIGGIYHTSGVLKIRLS